ncbi:MAG: anti-sigma factor family protein [Terriglobia bacterium]
MKCLDEGLLRAKIDGELDGAVSAAVDGHLASCAACRERLVRLERESQQIAREISALAPAVIPADETREALARIQTRIASEAAITPESGNFFMRFFAAHPAPAWGASAIAALVIVLITLAPARSAAQRVLAMLRVQKVTVVPVDFPAAPNRDTIARIRTMMSSRITVTLSPGKPQIEPDASAASKLAGFPVRVLTGNLGASRIAVLGEQAYVMTLDQARLQEILNDLGRSDLHIPAQVDGQTIAVHIPKAAFIRYGNCASPKSGANPAPPAADAATDAGCIRLAEVPSPIVSVPPGLNMNQLAEIVLQAAGMSEGEATAFCQTVDWKSTLVIPIPGNATSSQPEEVEGVEGTLIMGRPVRGRPGEFALIWVKNGTIYSIHGSGDPARALALAGSLS